MTLAATYGMCKLKYRNMLDFVMWKPMLTYGLLALTITGMTLFNVMT